VKARGGDEVWRPKLPVDVDAIDDLEPEGEPLHLAQHGRRVGLGGWHSFHGQDNLWFNFRRAQACRVERGLVALSEADRVVVHRRPDQRLELQGPPHRLVGETDFPPDGRMAARPAATDQRRFDGIRRVEIEPAVPRGRRHHVGPPRGIGGTELVRQ
jgi:hypothetical protein